MLRNHICFKIKPYEKVLRTSSYCFKFVLKLYKNGVQKNTIKCKNSKTNIKTQLNHNTIQINKPEGRKPKTDIAAKQ